MSSTQLSLTFNRYAVRFIFVLTLVMHALAVALCILSEKEETTSVSSPSSLLPATISRTRVSQFARCAVTLLSRLNCAQRANNECVRSGRPHASKLISENK